MPDKPFFISPWEHRGSHCSSAPGAQTALDIGGRKRDFLLKMRDGTIYFAEPKRAPMWAVTRQFERELRGDELIQAWRAEVERANFGRYVVTTPHLPIEGAGYDNSAPTALALVHRADYSGWAREWFERDWREIRAHRDGKTLDVWGGNFQAASKRALHQIEADLLDCALPDNARRDVETRWQIGGEAELRRVFGLATQLFARPRPALNRPAHWGPWIFVASNPISPGGWGFSGSPAYHGDLEFSPAFAPLLRLMETQFVLTGLTWERQQFRAPDSDYIAAMRAKWGGDWRGNRKVEVPFISLQVESKAPPSAHEKLEAQLQLRDWLTGKVSPRQCANWLDKTLD